MKSRLKEGYYAINKSNDCIVKVYTLLTDTFVDSSGRIHNVNDFEPFIMLTAYQN